MNRGYEDLANAIVVQAIKDYRTPSRRKEIERFLYSDWFETLTDVHPDYILKVCKEGVVPIRGV